MPRYLADILSIHFPTLSALSARAWGWSCRCSFADSDRRERDIVSMRLSSGWCRISLQNCCISARCPMRARIRESVSPFSGNVERKHITRHNFFIALHLVSCSGFTRATIKIPLEESTRSVEWRLTNDVPFICALLKGSIRLFTRNSVIWKVLQPPDIFANVNRLRLSQEITLYITTHPASANSGTTCRKWYDVR